MLTRREGFDKPLILHQFSPQNNLKIADYVKHPDSSFKLQCQIMTTDITLIFVNTRKYMKQDKGDILCNKFCLKLCMHMHWELNMQQYTVVLEKSKWSEECVTIRICCAVYEERHDY